MTAPSKTDHNQHLRNRSTLRTVTALVGTYLGLSVVTLVAMVVLRNDPTVVTTAVWIRGSLVTASAVLLFIFSVRASAGAPRAFLRVRIVSAIVLVAIAVIVALPGTFPIWFRIEQTACGILMLAVVILVNTKRLRAHFARP
jgi:hypothetical protein